MKCKNCGAELKPGALFCTECGTKVTDAEPTAENMSEGVTNEELTSIIAENQAEIQNRLMQAQGTKKATKEYKIVQGPMHLSVELGKTEQALVHFQQIINEQIKDGWQYHSMETLTISEYQTGCGCLSALGAYNTPVRVHTVYMLIFERDI